ncbi:Ku protein [Cytophagaceae bacterium ABcell3]|nr:Ku protein [Cytophagaceae bacterium ABcell3]
MRSIWSGAISFGLVNIPIKLYSAVGDTSLSFRQLSAKDHAPVRYKKVSSADGEELQANDIVKGYEYAKGQYLIVSEEDLEKVSPEKTKSVDIQQFIFEEEIDPIFFDKPYYLEPDKTASKPYALLREALAKSNKVGIASFVLRNKEHIAVIKPVDKVLVLSILRYADEVRDPNELNLPEHDVVNDKELEMAEMLINQLTDDFDPQQFRDTYSEELREILDAKARGEEVAERKEEKVSVKADNLLDTLRASLEAGKSTDRPPAKRKTSAKKKVKK